MVWIELLLLDVAENIATVMEIDHDSQQVITEQIRVTPEACDMAYLRPSEDAVATRLTSPIVTTYIDTDKISFERYVVDELARQVTIYYPGSYCALLQSFLYTFD